MQSIGFNPSVWKANYSMHAAERAINISLERLATGTRINRASDDPAGAVAVQKFDARLITIEKGIASAERANLSLAAREGGMSVVSDLLIDLKTAVVLAGNRDTMSDDEITALQDEASSIISTINFLANTTTYDGAQTLTSYASKSLGGVTAEVTQPDDTTLTERYSLADIAGGALNLLDGDLELALESVSGAIGKMARARSTIGTMMHDNDSRIATLQIELENTMSARSMINDTDYAAEMTALIRARVLQQASIHVALIAQHQQASVLSLLAPIS